MSDDAVPGAPASDGPSADGLPADDSASRNSDADQAAPGVVEAVPPAAASVFGSRLDAAVEYARLLCTDGVVRGVIGPREPARIWSRHVLNSAVVGELFSAGDRVVDVGSGAGLPGIALALAGPDISVDLLEPLQRRVTFLEMVVESLGLTSQVRVVRGRADDPAAVKLVAGADWATARAVAPLDRLVRWCMPLVRPHGRLALMKGSSAADEIEQHAGAMQRAGARHVELVSCGQGVVDPAVTVVMMTRAGQKG